MQNQLLLEKDKKIEFQELYKKAVEVSKNAYAPFSNFNVGSAILCENGKVYTGVNVENSSYGGSICAERVAVTKAVSFGDKSFEAIAIVGNGKRVKPCGICLQFMAEFNQDILIITGDSEDKLEICTLRELLPQSFELKKF